MCVVRTGGAVAARARAAVRGGLDMVDAGAMPIPPRFARLKVARYELERSVAHLYPALETREWPRVDER